jgi:hypothetical protein
VYEGEWKDGVRDGRGILMYANGNVYEGEWKDSVRDGRGILMYANGDVYEGKYDVRDGKGKCTCPTSNVFLTHDSHHDSIFRIIREDHF